MVSWPVRSIIVGKIIKITMMNLFFKNYELLRLLRNLNCWDICSFLSLKVGLKNPLGAEFCLNLCHSFDSNVQVDPFTYKLFKRPLLTGVINSLWDLCNSHLKFSKQKIYYRTYSAISRAIFTQILTKSGTI